MREEDAEAEFSEGATVDGEGAAGGATFCGQLTFSCSSALDGTWSSDGSEAPDARCSSPLRLLLLLLPLCC